MKVAFVNLREQNSRIYEQVKKAIEEIFASSAFVSGRHVAEFERDFARFVGVKECVAVQSGTSALILALKALGIGAGDEVVVPAATFVATAEAVEWVGARVRLADIDPHTWTIDPASVERALTPRTRAIIAVHLYGQCAHMDALREIAQKHNLYLIEDAAQAHGATHNGRQAGSMGDVACFSFYPAKNLGAWGEGGACTTNNSQLAEKIRLLRDHGSPRKYEHVLVGGNFRMEELQGLVLKEKLRYLPQWNQARQQAARLYAEMLTPLAQEGFLQLPHCAPEGSHVYHLYVVSLKNGYDRHHLIEFLASRGIPAAIHYPQPIHLLPAFGHLGYRKGDFPVAEHLFSSCVSLPMHEALTATEVCAVCDAIKEFFVSVTV